MNAHERTIASVPTVDIARWNAKLNRISYATQAQTMASRDTGQTAWALADPSYCKDKTIRKYWIDEKHRGRAYDELMIYELQNGIALESIRRALEHKPTSIDPLVLPTETKREAIIERSDSLMHQAYREALGRVGLVAAIGAASEVLPAAEAALVYRAPDIHRAVDRALYDRWEEIDAQTEAIEDAVRPRGFVNRQDRTQVSVYRAVHSLPELPVSREYTGLTATTPEGMWWEELDHDLNRIDAVQIPSV